VLPLPRTIQRWLATTLLLASLLGAYSLAAGSSTAHAQVQNPEDLNEVADYVWDVADKSGLSRHTNASLNIVWDLHEQGAVIYVAGDFTTLVAPDGTEQAQSFLAAFNTLTGEPLATFNPSLNNVVYSVETNNAGQIVVGGEFDGGVAILDAATGARVTTFDADLSNVWGTPAIYSLKVNGGWVYAGGNFNRAQGSTVDRLVRLDRSTGALDTTWRPTLEAAIYNGETREYINDLEIDAARNRLYVAGWFGSVNGEPETDSLAVLDLETGEKAADHPNISYDNREITFLYDAALDGDTLHYGGKENFTITANADTFERNGKVAYTNNGDHQVMHVGENTLWIGCHCWRQAFVAEPPNNPFEPTADAIDVNGLFGIDKATGEVVQQTFDLRGTAGVWDIEEDQHGRLWAAGQFTRTGGRSVQGLVRFSPATGPASAVQACTARSDGQNTVVTWTGGNSPEFYVVRRAVGGGDPLWRARLSGTERTFQDRNTPDNVTYTVEAKVRNAVIAEPVTCDTVVTTVQAPTTCVVTGANDSIDVSWTRAADDNADRFIVRRSRDGNALSWAASVAAPGTSWTDANVSAGPGYGYTVEARAGNMASAPTSCTPNPIVLTASAVLAPTACTVSEVDGDVAVSWTRAANDNADRFIVRRSRDGNALSWAARLSAPATSWVDANVLAGPSYSYAVEAHGGITVSPGTTCTPDPIVVAGLTPATPASCSVSLVNDAVVVTWAPGANDNSDAFIVRRSRDGNAPSWAARVDAPGTTWTDTNLAAGATYEYQVEGRLGTTLSPPRQCSGGPIGR
jgi:hypothetical protein